MKRVLALTLALVLTLSLLAGCGAKDTPAPTEESKPVEIATIGATEPEKVEEPVNKYGGTLIYSPGVQDEQNLGNPSAPTNMLMNVNATPALESLFRQNTKGEIECWLAEDYDVSDDGLVYTIKIRQGITFHDGSPLNGESVAWNIQACVDNGKGQYSRVEKVEVTGEYEVTITMSMPDILFLPNIAADPCGLIISQKSYEENGPEWCEKNPVGTGPFKFVSWENDVEVVYTRNENYWGKDADGNQLPYLDGIRVKYISDNTVAEAALESGDVMVWVRADPDSLTKFLSKDNFTVEKAAIPSSNHNLIACNGTDNPAAVFEVREAVAYAVDFETIVSDLFGLSCVVTEQNSVPGRIFNKDDLVTREYNPEKAKELLQQAGYGDGVEINFYASNSSMAEQMLVAMIPYLEAVGITAHVELLDAGGYFGLLTGNFVDGFVIGSYGYAPDEFGKMYNLASNSAALKLANTHMDDETYQMFEDARSARTIEEAAEIYKQIQESVYLTNRYFISYMTQYDCIITENSVKDTGFYTCGGGHWTPEVAYIAK